MINGSVKIRKSNQENSKATSELLMSWTPWLSTSSPPSSSNLKPTTQSETKNQPHIHHHQNQVKDKNKSQWIKKFFRSTHQIQNKKLKKLKKKPKPFPTSVPPIIKIINVHQSQSKALIEERYQNIIYQTNLVQPNLRSKTNPRLISLTSAQAFEAQKRMIGLAR